MSETWIRPDTTSANLSEITPPGYKLSTAASGPLRWRIEKVKGEIKDKIPYQTS